MKRIMRDERGMALAVAIFALVVVGALVAGAFYAGTQEQRVGENGRRLQQSFGVAEAGLSERVRNWSPDTINAKGNYPSDSFTINRTTTANKTGSFSGAVYRLNGELYFVSVSGSDTASLSGKLRNGGARQRIGMLQRIQPLQIDIEASLTAKNSVSLSGNAGVDGTDHVPGATWACPPLDTSLAGVRTTGTVSTQGNAYVTGNPQVKTDPNLKDSTFTQYGPTSYDALAARATLTLSGNGTYKTQPSFNADGSCNKADQMNWGDGDNRASACGNYFPIIHITGSATLNGVEGQGILLVDGDLNVQGSYNFYGITIIKGGLKTAGGGSTVAHFYGGVMAQDANLDPNTLTGKATLLYSKCAIVQALEMTGTASTLRSRAWVQVF